MILINNENDTAKNTEILYMEWVPTGKFVKILVAFVFLFIIVFLFLFIILTILTVLELQVLIFFAVIMGVFSIFLLFFFWNYRGLRITINKNQIEIKYGIFNRKQISLKKIIECKITKASFRKYGGVGVRLGFDGSWAYNTDFGEAVKLIYQNSKPFVFSTRNPQKICNLILELSN